MDSFTAVRLLEVARSQLGVKESPPGSNRNKYGKAVGRDGEPWCAMFVTWCFREIGRPLPDVNGPDGLFTYCPSAVRWALRNGQTVAVPEPGDIVLYDWQRDDVSDHVGIVETVLSPLVFRAVEGNTAVGQDSDGGEVMSRIRHAADVTLFWRPPIAPLTKTTGTTEEEDDVNCEVRYGFEPSWAADRLDGTRPVVEVDAREGAIRGYHGVAFEPRDLMDGDPETLSAVDVSGGRLKGGPVRFTFRAGNEVTFVTTAGNRYKFTAVPA